MELWLFKKKNVLFGFHLGGELGKIEKSMKQASIFFFSDLCMYIISSVICFCYSLPLFVKHLHHNSLIEFQGGYRGFYSKNTLTLSPKVVNDIHKRGGTILRTSRGGHDTNKIVDNIEDRGINQVISVFFFSTIEVPSW